MNIEDKLKELYNYMLDKRCLLSNEQAKFLNECDIKNLTNSQRERIYNIHGAFQVIQATIKYNNNIIRKK